MNIVAKRKIFYTFSILLNLVGIFGILFWGLRFGIDFKGGSFMEVQFSSSRPEISAVKNNLASLNLGDVAVQPAGDKGFNLRFKDVDEPTHQQILQSLNSLALAE